MLRIPEAVEIARSRSEDRKGGNLAGLYNEVIRFGKVDLCKNHTFIAQFNCVSIIYLNRWHILGKFYLSLPTFVVFDK